MVLRNRPLVVDILKTLQEMQLELTQNKDAFLVKEDDLLAPGAPKAESVETPNTGGDGAYGVETSVNVKSSFY